MHAGMPILIYSNLSLGFLGISYPEVIYQWCFGTIQANQVCLLGLTGQISGSLARRPNPLKHAASSGPLVAVKSLPICDGYMNEMLAG